MLKSLRSHFYPNHKHRVYLIFCNVRRYESELHATEWTSIRKGAVYGLSVGWFTFALYTIYSVGFMSGSLLMNYDERGKPSAGDVLIVSDSIVVSKNDDRSAINSYRL
jgi:hypothetical protein